MMKDINSRTPVCEQIAEDFFKVIRSDDKDSIFKRSLELIGQEKTKSIVFNTSIYNNYYKAIGEVDVVEERLKRKMFGFLVFRYICVIHNLIFILLLSSFISLYIKSIMSAPAFGGSHSIFGYGQEYILVFLFLNFLLSQITRLSLKNKANDLIEDASLIVCTKATHEGYIQET